MKPPTEEQEAIVFANWLGVYGVPFSHIPNETGSDPAARRRAVRMKRQGVMKGFFDYIIFIPSTMSVDGDGYCIAIELKRASKSLSRVSPEQEQWQGFVNTLGADNIQAYVCYGAAEAIKTVSYYLETTDNSIF